MIANSPISVVIAVRDADKTLQASVQSMLRQTLPPQEILLILNGCSDGTESIAQTLASQDVRIRLLSSSPAGGVAEAAKLGCEAALSPLIARMDADDISHPQRLSCQLETLQQEHADLVTCRVTPITSLGDGLDRFVHWANSLHRPPDFQNERFVESPVIQPGVLMTKEVYLQAGGYRIEDGPEDYDLWLRMLENGARFFQAPRALLQWRDSSTRLTRSHDDYSEKRMNATKARYLARLRQAKEQGIVIAGSGPIGRRLAKLLIAENVAIKGFFDISPKKIGNTVLGLPVWSPDELGMREREALLLGCVGRGGRERVRIIAQKAGYHEGNDFFACC
ncbi:MAG: glycosyltransferase [Roseibacillus sp.]